MTRAEIVAHNRGVALVAALATASADRLRAKLTEKPTHYSFAIEALDALVEGCGDLCLQLDAEPAPRLSTDLKNNQGKP